MKRDEKILRKFVIDPKYRKRVIENIHREEDYQYERRIKILRSEKEKLIKKRAKEITRVSEARWESVAGGKLLVNITEGKVKINQGEFLFSDIKGAEPNVQYVSRVVSTEKGESKKHASLGGGLVGGIIGGVPGAIIGGVGLGKTTSNGQTTQNEIPICTHIGVMININGFVSEIVLLNKQVELTDSDFEKAQKEAQNIITKLTTIAQISVTDYLKVEDEPSVKAFDTQIINKENEIKFAIDDKPTYKIPEVYRTNAQKHMSDEEYLAYLDNEINPLGEKIVENIPTSEKKEDFGVDSIEPLKEIVIESIPMEERKEKVRSGSSPAKRVCGVIGSVFGWIVSVFTSIFLTSATIQRGVVSAILFSISVLAINPLMYKLLKSKMKFLRVWMCIILFVITFVIGLITFPSEATNITSQVLI